MKRRASVTDNPPVGDVSGAATTGVDVIVWPVFLTRRDHSRLPAGIALDANVPRRSIADSRM
jgi:hypothetical protein